ncbi:hypothetical protein BDV23DRAFT_178196 [Aspergillus alliaceus]|uniref:Uncharacterized protein n=1 Tax=Petromyces alliaceus TaxID=209559 RepID=A0A5N7CQF4_PETAA|nr:hypothetical protein BDV23DRAFT_178196 [Aspergillus alliaceus]
MDTPPPRTTSITTPSIPEITIIGGKPYTVTEGTINVDGTTIRLPNLGGSEQVSTTVENVPMAIIPSYSGTMAVPVFPTAKPTSDSGSDPTPSSTSTSTTATTSSAEPAPTSADGVVRWGNKVCAGINVIPSPASLWVVGGKEVIHGAGSRRTRQGPFVIKQKIVKQIWSVSLVAGPGEDVG